MKLDKHDRIIKLVEFVFTSFLQYGDIIMITYAAISEKGDRSINEDSIAIKRIEENFCFALADGLGGHGRGEVASQMVVEQVIDYYESHGMDDDFISKAFEICQTDLLEAQQRLHAANEMKTTMVVCSILNKTLKWGHIGDSRLYVFNGHRLKKRTLDHSVPQMLALAHDIKEKDIRNHPDRNRLLRVMGTQWERMEYELGEDIHLTPKLSIMLCSDGFWELINEKLMVKCLRNASSVQEWLNNMKEIVEQNGLSHDMDNYSAICIWCR